MISWKQQFLMIALPCLFAVLIFQALWNIPWQRDIWFGLDHMSNLNDGREFNFGVSAPEPSYFLQFSPFLSMNRWGSYWLKFVSMKAKTAALRHPWGLVQRILSKGQREVCPEQLALGPFGVVPCSLIRIWFWFTKADLRPVRKGWDLQLR